METNWLEIIEQLTPFLIGGGAIYRFFLKGRIRFSLNLEVDGNGAIEKKEREDDKDA